MKKIISLIVETRESDCPQYNYRNWKEVAEHNYEHKKVSMLCMFGIL